MVDPVAQIPIAGPLKTEGREVNHGLAARGQAYEFHLLIVGSALLRHRQGDDVSTLVGGEANKGTQQVGDRGRGTNGLAQDDICMRCWPIGEEALRIRGPVNREIRIQAEEGCGAATVRPKKGKEPLLPSLSQTAARIRSRRFHRRAGNRLRR